ncbi:MAG: SlyX family protein [bacterium]|nr:SlyX family protein [bacterium]
MQDLNARVTQLEISLAHQQHLCDQLNEIVSQQNRTLLRFEKLIPALQKQILDLRAEQKERPSAAEERPPHY